MPSTHRRRQLIKGLLAIGSSAPIASCSNKPHHPNLGELYNRSAQRSGISRNPIIVIPGILGSYLKHTPSNERVWGVIGRNSIRKNSPKLAHPMEEGKKLHELRDDILSDGVLDSLVLSLGARFEVQAYAQLLAALGAGGYIDQSLGESGAIDYGTEHYNCFQFAFDWRRSCVENAARLDAFITQRRAYVQEQNRKLFGRSGNVKFDIVAHSMGGLIARYYQMYGAAPLPSHGGIPKLTWAGARHLDKVILVATPNAGSCGSFTTLRNGLYTTRLTGRFSPSLIGTLPSIYELLPRERQGYIINSDGKNTALFDPQVWESNGWGLASPKADTSLSEILPNITDPSTRRRIALDHQRKCLKNAAQFHAAIDRPTKLPKNASLYLFAGDSEKTPRVVTLDANQSTFTTTSYTLGDSTVPRSSALLDERTPSDTGRLKTPIDWTQVTFISGSHIGLTKNPTFTDNMLYLLLED